ncbi:MAG: helix-turn-helix transcriptional regulator [Flavobacteriaceae bacterium]|nr:helix-turn-helix transcriptional regulator [Flavobacteriaceae bacterium]
MGIGLRIKELRKEKKITQKALCELIKVDNSQFSKIEQEKSLPTIKQIIELSSILEKSIDWIITGKEFDQQGLGMLSEPTQLQQELLSTKRLLEKEEQHTADLRELLNLQNNSKQNAG